MVERLRSASSAFFGSTQEAKQRAHVGSYVGYLGVGTENVGDSAPSPVESLNLPGYQEAGCAWIAKSASATCPWRHATWLPEQAGFRQAALDYWGSVTAVLTWLMDLCEVALGLSHGFFTESSFALPSCLLRIANYPATEEAASDEKRGLRYGAHTDYFFCATILQRAAGDACLQVETVDHGRWLTVPANPNTLTVIIGDMFSRWTNDRWRAPTHRVVSSSQAEERLAVAFFTGPHPQTLVECVPSLKCYPDKTRYEPITAAEHVRAGMEYGHEEAKSMARASRRFVPVPADANSGERRVGTTRVKRPREENDE